MSAPFPGPAGRDAVLTRIREHPLGATPEAMRAGFARLVLGGDASGPPAAPGVTVMPGEDAVTVRPKAQPGAAPVLWFHGGGYVFGSPETHVRPAARLARRTGRTVVLPRYPLAPEARWPAQRDAALAAVDAVDGPVVLAGDSAGGHLALVCALALARRGRPAEALLLFSPNTDRSGLNRARRPMSRLDPMVDDRDDAALAALCFGHGFDPADPEVSPLLDDLSLLPPTHVEVGQPEVLRDDAVLLHDRARRAGGPITLAITPGLLHMGQLWSPWWREANASLDRAGDHLTRMAGLRRAG